MKYLLSTLCVIIFFLMGADSAKACDPVHAPFNELLDDFNPSLNTAVEGYFISSNTFKVTYSYDPAIKIGSEKKVFEYGPFGSQCEVHEMESSVDAGLIVSKSGRLLFLYKDRSKGEKLVTPIFHGNGVSISSSAVTFDHHVPIDKAPYSREYRFSTTLEAVRKRFTQNDRATPMKWDTKLIEK